MMEKRNRETLNFNMVIGKDKSSIGGFQLSQFAKATAIPMRSDAPPSVALKPEDFYEADFRMLSSTIVGTDSWKCCDFSEGSVLKDALSLFERKPVYTDHDTWEVKNAVGMVKKVWWDNVYMLEGNVKVPSGVNGTLAIDITNDMGLKLARSIEMGAIFSVSVGIEFDWEASHTFEDRWGFYDNIGSIQKDGAMCRRIVKTIYNINECSLVHLGADGYAKLLDEDGKIVNPDFGQISIHKALGLSKDDFKEKSPETANNYKIICGYDKSLLGLSKAYQDLNKENNTGDMKDFKYFLGKFGLSEADFANEEVFVEKMKDILEGNKNLLGLQKVSDKAKEIFGQDFDALKKEDVTFGQDLVTLRKEHEDFKKELDSLKGKQEEKLNKLRTDAEAKYRAVQLAKKADVDETIVELFKESDETKIVSLAKTFGIQFGEELHGKCGKCGSKEINFRSTVSDKDPEDDEVVEIYKGGFEFLARKKQVENNSFLGGK